MCISLRGYYLFFFFAFCHIGGVGSEKHYSKLSVKIPQEKDTGYDRKLRDENIPLCLGKIPEKMPDLNSPLDV